MKSKELELPPRQLQQEEKRFWRINIVFSLVAVSLIAYLLLFHKAENSSEAFAFMPSVNASFNALSATLLLLGGYAIKRGKREVHERYMKAAFLSSSFFLVGYLVYHYAHGDTKYPPSASGRTFYLLVLASHVILSLPVVPMALASFYYAFKKAFVKHKRLTRILYPIWLYVSVTGVLVFLLLRVAQ